MNNRVRCPECQVLLSVPEKLVGADIRCPKCHESVAVPIEDGIEVDDDQRSGRVQQRTRYRKRRNQKSQNAVLLVAGVIGAIAVLSIVGMIVLVVALTGNRSQKTDGTQLGSAGPTEGWREFISKEGGFSVLTPPGNVEQKSNEIMFADRSIGTVTMLRIQGSGVGILYGEIPARYAANSTAERILGELSTGELVPLQGHQVQSSRANTVLGCPARDLTLKSNIDGRITHVRLVLSGNRFFELLAREADSKTLFDSFKLAR